MTHPAPTGGTIEAPMSIRGALARMGKLREILPDAAVDCA